MYENNREKKILMKELTSMKVGGPVNCFLESENEAELIECVEGLKGEPHFVLGNGTNVIVRDGGYAGAVISTLKALRGMSAEGTKIVCGAGESLARVCRFAAENGLSGLEELSGIPGTVGGAAYMNAGAYDREIADVIAGIRVYDAENKNIIMLTNEECLFGYRKSVFKSVPMIILSVELSLAVGDKDRIEAEMLEFTKLRNEKQPVDLPSAGSFFKRPEGNFAGRLIESAGLKGASVGGAQVSEKHAGFIVNTGGATAADVLALADMVKKKVFENSGVVLEEEPIVIGM